MADSYNPNNVDLAGFDDEFETIPAEPEGGRAARGRTKAKGQRPKDKDQRTKTK